jgi:carbamate kinase
MLGYLLSQALQNELPDRTFAALSTRTLVSATDPSQRAPRSSSVRCNPNRTRDGLPLPEVGPYGRTASCHCEDAGRLGIGAIVDKHLTASLLAEAIEPGCGLCVPRGVDGAKS